MRQIACLIFTLLFASSSQALIQNRGFEGPVICESADWYETAMQKVAERYNGEVENRGEQDYSLYVVEEGVAYRIPFIIYEEYRQEFPSRLFYKACLVTN